MAASRKRKHESDDPQPAQQNIKAFANVRKPRALGDGLKRRKIVQQRDATPPAPPISSTKVDKKRKRALDTVDAGAEDGDVSENASRDGNSRKLAAIHGNNTTRNKRHKNIQPLSPAETPTKSAVALFDKLRLNATSKPIPFSLIAQQAAYVTPPDTPESTDLSGQLPQELEDLLQLHSALLSALSLYYAHNGTSSSVGVRALLPLITKSWRKRSVSLDDLRLILAVGHGTESGFALQDFGRAGICLARSQPRGRATKRAASYIDESGLNDRFEAALQQSWATWLSSTPKENRDAAAFLDQLSLAEIEKSESVAKALPLFARGQLRLADLKASQAAATTQPSSPPALAAEQKSSQAAGNRGTTLLDRILVKQAVTSSLPAGPTREQLERKAALHRVEDIARVLDLLAAGRSRCSYSMPAIAQQLQQSLRNPISKGEVQMCLDIMAKEVTPGFVSLVKSGSVTGVVVTKAGKVGLQELRQRIDRAVV